MAEQTHTVEVDGLKLEVQVGHHTDGTPYVELVPAANTRLEGDCPGFYFLTPDES